MKYKNQQISPQTSQTINKPGKNYIRGGKILGFLALIMVPATPLYWPVFCERRYGWKCNIDELEFIFIPIYIAVVLAITSVALLVIGFRRNRTL